MKHVSGHFPPQYVLILLARTGPPAKLGGFQPSGMADFGQNREPWLYRMSPRLAARFASRFSDPRESALIRGKVLPFRSRAISAITAIPAISLPSPHFTPFHPTH